MKKERNEGMRRNNSMIMLKALKGPFCKDIELECKKEALSYHKKIGQFYRVQDIGMYTGHFFTLLRKDNFFGNNRLISKTPKYYH